jgi:hypothetical protein
MGHTGLLSEERAMPTTPKEAIAVATIIKKYLPLDKAKDLTAELNDKVGKVSDNNSVKMSLAMLANCFEHLNTDAMLKTWQELGRKLGYTDEEMGMSP